MKTVFISTFLSIMLTSSFSLCHAQKSNDTLKQIFSSKSFTIEENYIGDWGGHVQTFSFNMEGSKLRIKCDNPDPLSNTKKLDSLTSMSVLIYLENIFTDCSSKIKTSKNTSTEHIIYTFKTDKFTYIIDDKFTMECNESYKKWKGCFK